MIGPQSALCPPGLLAPCVHGGRRGPFLDGDLGLAGLWWLWAVLWATFWVLLGLQLDEYTVPIAWFTTLVGIVTGVAGYLMAAGFCPWAL